MRAGAVRIVGDARTFEHLAAWMKWLATSSQGDSYELHVGWSFNADAVGATPQVYVVDEHMAGIDLLFDPGEPDEWGDVSFHTRDTAAFTALVGTLHATGRHGSRPAMRDDRAIAPATAPKPPTISALTRSEIAAALSLGVRRAYDRTYDAARDELLGDAEMGTIESVSPVDGARCIVQIAAAREFVDAGGRRFIEMAVVARCRGFIERLHVSAGDSPRFESD